MKAPRQLLILAAVGFFGDGTPARWRCGRQIASQFERRDTARRYGRRQSGCAGLRLSGSETAANDPSVAGDLPVPVAVRAILGNVINKAPLGHSSLPLRAEARFCPIQQILDGKVPRSSRGKRKAPAEGLAGAFASDLRGG
jgi:hypothetical protein